jgi:hypothetical protein
MRFLIAKVTIAGNTDFWGMAPCTLVDVERRFGRKCGLDLRDRRYTSAGLHSIKSHKIIFFSYIPKSV